MEQSYEMWFVNQYQVSCNHEEILIIDENYLRLCIQIAIYAICMYKIIFMLSININIFKLLRKWGRTSLLSKRLHW